MGPAEPAIIVTIGQQSAIGAPDAAARRDRAFYPDRMTTLRRRISRLSHRIIVTTIIGVPAALIVLVILHILLTGAEPQITGDALAPQIGTP